MKLKYPIFIVILFFVIGLYSCASSSIVSKKSLDFKEPVSKILLVVNDGGKAFDYFAGLKNLLFSEFLKLKVLPKITLQQVSYILDTPVINLENFST